MRKRNYKIVILKIILFILTLFLIFLCYIYIKQNILKEETIGIIDTKNIIDSSVKKIIIDDNKMSIVFNKSVKCSLDGVIFDNSNDKKCVYDFNDKIKTIYYKDLLSSPKTFDISDYIKLYNITKDNTIYIANGGVEDISYLFKDINLDKKIEINNDDNIVSNLDNFKLKGENVGSTNINIVTDISSFKMNVLVTSLISVKGTDFNYDKPYLPCGVYSKSDNDLLDEILVSRVNRGGYLTRAGVVEAGRFLTLEFPYRINYFSENGRMADSPKADGEGRYYHKGLYLDSSRFDLLNKDYIVNGPNPWGCDIYSNPAGGVRNNAFDCSGFISWIIRQADYDPTDMGAGVDDWRQDFTDLGFKQRPADSIREGTIKIGDLLSGDGEVEGFPAGGHIAMLVGIKDGYYYVAEELWGGGTGYVGAVIKKYSYESFIYYFYWHINMDEFYKEDGNLTDYWF